MRKKGKNGERKEEGEYNTTVDCTTVILYYCTTIILYYCNTVLL
jgi:hypothetical protein